MADACTFYRSFYEVGQTLPDDERLQFYDGILAYALNSIVPEFKGILSQLFTVVKPNIDQSIKNRTFGSSGGRPKNNPPFNPPLKGEDKPPFKASKEDKSKEEDIYGVFVSFLNSSCKRSYRGGGKSVAQFNNRLKDGYELEDFKTAVIAACAEQFHIDSNFKYLTPEFFTRQDKLDKFLSKPLTKLPLDKPLKSLGQQAKEFFGT